MLTGMENLTCPEQLRKIDLPTFVYCRHRGDMIEVYKLLHEEYDNEVTMHLSMNNNQTWPNSYKLRKDRYTTKKFQDTFRHRVTDLWNGLPSDVVTAPSISSFERPLDKFWASQPIKCVSRVLGQVHMG